MNGFHFVVRHLRWLACIPLLPQLFDGLLLGWTFLFRRHRIALMEMLEREALRIPGVETHVHRFGGVEFRASGQGELGHIHGHGLLDVKLTRTLVESLHREGRVRRHHVFPFSRWVSFQLEGPSDVPFAVGLLKSAAAERRAE